MSEAELKGKKFDPHFPVVTIILFRQKSKRLFRKIKKSANYQT